MASGMYDAGPSSSAPLSYPTSRRPTGSGPLSYERPLSRRRTPSPHRHYGNDDPVYHSNYPNVYRPNYWPGRGSSYDGLSPSPDRFERSREPDVDPRDRSGGWGPHSESHWEGGSSFRREPMLAATRMFEPSETWKRNHDERSAHSSTYNPGSPVIDKHPDRSGRDFVDLTSERSARNDRLLRDDDRHYRPSQSFTSETNGRSGYNSYRPTYDRDSSSSQMRKRSVSGSVVNDGRNGRCSSTRSSSRDSRTRSRSFSRDRSQRRSSSKSRLSARPPLPTRNKLQPRSTSSSRSQRRTESRASTSRIRPLAAKPQRSYSRVRPSRSRSRSRSYSDFRSRSPDDKSRRRSSSRGRSLSRHRRQPTPDRVSEPRNERRSWSRSSIASSRASPPPPPTTTAVESIIDVSKPASDTQMIEQPIKEPKPVIKSSPSPEPTIPEAKVPVARTSPRLMGSRMVPKSQF
ncbi:hypothetical protein EDD85DRAFT_561845 [Armillaria nabsnona]|nr:hypothetical protein EDD85DRAFT_561845 [Armillaria nabsnona]